MFFKKPAIYPAGYALCIVELYHIELMKRAHEKVACCKTYPRAQSWFLRNLRVFKEPIPMTGKLNIFTLELPKNIHLR
ncbi:MAG: hypothetical protein AUJ71_03030 [Candidatus Omnitrophica bacterium CG1_02_49_16]|nr:MAG: hypothetical protein AUJ71_03030 [Candidatus Omnitrophica bacterium CG1_02_49_16]